MGKKIIYENWIIEKDVNINRILKNIAEELKNEQQWNLDFHFITYGGEEPEPMNTIKSTGTKTFIINWRNEEGILVSQ
jgi:hypothetical protein